MGGLKRRPLETYSPEVRNGTVSDYVDLAESQWQELEPDLPLSSIGIIGRIARIAHIVQDLSDQALFQCGITRDEFDILSLLSRSGRPMAPSDMSSTLLTSAPATTKRIKKLVKAGLVTRESNPLDGRGALISMTDSGREVIGPILRTVLAFECTLLESLPSETRESLTDNLRALLTNLEQREGSAPAEGVELQDASR